MDRRTCPHRLTRILFYILFLILGNISNVSAVEDYLVHIPFLRFQFTTDNGIQDERPANQERCRGMYAKSAMGGNIDPYINIIFSPIKGDEPQIVSLIIFAWTDIQDVGIVEQNGEVLPPTFLCYWLTVESVHLRYTIH